MQLATQLIEFAPGYKRMFTNAPVSMDFKHKLNRHGRRIEDGYSLSKMSDSGQNSIIYGIVFHAMQDVRAAFVVNVEQMQGNQDAIQLVINNQIQDYIKNVKPALIAKVFQRVMRQLN